MGSALNHGTLRATVNAMDGRALLRMDMGFYIGSSYLDARGT